MIRRPGSKLYRLVFDGSDGEHQAAIELQSDGPQGALLAATRIAPEREVAIFEDGRRLARVRIDAGAGYLVLNPPTLAPARSVETAAHGGQSGRAAPKRPVTQPSTRTEAILSQLRTSSRGGAA